MALESIEGAGKYISDLDENNPLNTDNPGTDGDNHLRGIKNTIKNTFPNITGAVTATQDELNYVDVATLGTSEASKAVTADANGNVTFADGALDVDVASHDGTNGLKLGGTLVTSSAAELNLLDGKTVVDDGGYHGVTASFGGAMTLSTVFTLNSTNISGMTEVFDTDGWFTLSTGVFLPDKAGYYSPVVSISASSITTSIAVYVNKNGVTSYSSVEGQVSGICSVFGSFPAIYLNGTTDYLEIRFNSSGDASWSFVSGSSIGFNLVGT